MIHFNDLNRNNGGEVVYTWQDDRSGFTRMWATERMEKWLPTSGIEIQVAAVEEARAKWIYENRGVENHRLEWLTKHPEALLNPAIMMRMEASVLHNEPREIWDLMLDGHHRYVVLAILGSPLFKLYHLTEAQARQFEVEGHPQPTGQLNINAFSGIRRD